MGGNAAGMVLRLALKTRFSVMGMGFDSSAARQFLGAVMKLFTEKAYFRS
jgi:hypothetical protein